MLEMPTTTKKVLSTIDDGAGWSKSLRPLQETHLHNDYVFNLSMIEDGALDSLLEN